MRKPVLALAAMVLLAGCAPYASVGYGTGYNGFNVGTGINSISRWLLRQRRASAPGRSSSSGRWVERRLAAGRGLGSVAGPASWLRSERERCWARSWDRASAVRLTARTRSMPGRLRRKPMRHRSERRSSGAIPIAEMRGPSGRPARVGPRQAPIAASSSSRSSSAGGCDPPSGRPVSSRMVTGGSLDSGLPLASDIAVCLGCRRGGSAR